MTTKTGPERAPPSAGRRAGALALLLTGLGGCAVYSPLPLPKSDDLAASLPETPAHGATPAPDPARANPPPLDMSAIATLAVLNNPDLKAARAKLHVASAQAFAAGILPDPQLSASMDRPRDHVYSARDPRYPEYNAYNFGLALDLRALLTHSSTHAAATAAYRQAQEELLWQEWQTIAEARTLYVAQALGAERLDFLQPAADVYTLAVTRSGQAFAQGNVTLDQAGTDQSVLVSVRAQQGAAERASLQAQQSLRALLGLRAEVTIPLQPLAAPVIPERAEVAAAAERLPQVRPDLRALQEGYRAEEAQVRVAVLSQFPNIVIGVTRARDVSDVHTFGNTLGMSLPIFDRGQGDIRIQRATRAQLRAEYQSRLDQASSDIWQLWNEMQELRRELDDVDGRLPQLQRSLDNATRAARDHNFPSATYLGLVTAYLAARGSRFDLLQSLWSDSIALATVMGTQVITHPDPTTP